MLKIIQTDHWINQKVTKSFAIGTGGNLVSINDYIFEKNDIHATYGILRGTENILKKSNNFYYLDHGYFGSSKRSFRENGQTLIQDLSGYFRIVKNDLIYNKLNNFDDYRLKKFNLKFQEIRKSGKFIIVSEPSKYISNFYNLSEWTKKTINELEKYTDRKIFIHNKSSPIPLNELLKHAWAFVSFQSTAGLKSMIHGVPAHFTHKNLQFINPIKNIENGLINYQLFNNLSYSQWTLNEIENNEMNEYLNVK